jgi:hypothetical protein
MQTTQARTIPEITFGAVKSKDEIVRLIREVVQEVREKCAEDRRADTRCPICVPVEVTVCNPQSHRNRWASTMVSKDVSATGMSILHTASVRDHLLMVSFPQSKQHAEHRLILEVTHRRPVGPLWEIGGRFVTESESGAN